ncbi:ABC transporter substrate-binding protein [Sphaerochaeta sp. PS]|uniref:ABC transporter substrate-binding protein n=1 Tax=Sphaerochaeta sp. PS TaxID=3076336 RepID=UPI0028A3A8A3|nr:extracellular solute-binding protein [Sphaerochaeta sp. PS]MDT4762935.1 extracellular solute-binding protein [Sphaerochaeta sp. PS]
MKKSLLLLLVCLVLVTPLFAGGASETKQAGPIKIWAWDPNFNISIMNEAISRYQAKHPEATFEVVELAKADVEQKLHTNLASRTKEGLPDIVLIEDYNVQKYLTSYPGQFADLSSAFNYNDFVGYKADVMKLDGKYYGVPFDSGVAGFFYRTDLLKKAGFTAQDLENITWDRFADIAKEYKAKTGQYLIANDKSDGGLFRIMLQSAGSWYFDNEGKPALVNNAALMEAMKLYKRFVAEDLALPSNGWNEWVGSFNSGKVASVITGVWIIGSIKAGVDQSGLWAVAPTPRLSLDKSVNASNLGGSSWFVLQNGANRDKAIAFMQEIYGNDKGFYQTILMNNGAIGSYMPAFSGDAFKALDPFFGNKAIFTDLSRWASMIPKVNVGQYTYEADAAVMAVMEDYYNGKTTLEQAVKSAENQLKNSIQ